jgi:hypothetical protein
MSGAPHQLHLPRSVLDGRGRDRWRLELDGNTKIHEGRSD